jgi:methylmalonyl-CoA/ethylmalonyl-CoA epimerase
MDLSPPRRLGPLDHIGIAVHDIYAALPYYLVEVGFQLTHRERLGEIATELAYLDGGGAAIQLVAPTGPGNVATFLEAEGEGLPHVCVAVDELQEAVAVLSPTGQDNPFMGGRGRQACFLSHRPNGVLIELTENHGRPCA